eukprot:TRINITY_DN405_c0_g1_i1.p2 TRINITY_DN405_c0_g1~~TRINITY_DN405_c0_g1_i1.p2  ORF type:complete len:409 (+),score=223.00 TRINITY_DN405_c0_g1_i1:90-1316(+)
MQPRSSGSYTTYVVIAALVIVSLFGIHSMNNQPASADVPVADKHQTTREAPAVVHKDNTKDIVDAIQPLVQTVSDKIGRLDGDVRSLSSNYNILLEKLSNLEAQNTKAVRANQDLAEEVHEVKRGLTNIDSKVEKINTDKPESHSVRTEYKKDNSLALVEKKNKAIYENAKAIEDQNLANLKTSSTAKAHYRQHTYLHYLFEPVWNCPNKEKVPFVADDGAKYVCNTDRLADLGDECIIYSIGVNNKAESMFDFDLATRYPNCRFFLMDPSLDARRTKELTSDLLPNMEFHEWGIAPTISTFTNGRLLLPIDEIKRRLGHTGKRITSLKVDTEGAEWLTIPAFMDTEEGQLVDEMQIEVHFYSTNFETIVPFFEAIRNKGYVIFSKDMNGHCGNICMEYAWVNLSLVE